MKENLSEIYGICRDVLGAETWSKILACMRDHPGRKDLPSRLEECKEEMSLPDFVPELAKLEKAYDDVLKKDIEDIPDTGSFEINPLLELFNVSWKFSSFMRTPGWNKESRPEEGREWVMIWKEISSGEMKISRAGEDDLMVLKIISEDIPWEEIPGFGDISEEEVKNILKVSADKGIILAPRPKIKRDRSIFADTAEIPDKYIYAETFTLQWHITHACDLRCKHCYDRSDRSPLTMEQGVGVLDDMLEFCKLNSVEGHICFTGGNPLMYPYFFALYKAAADRGFSTSILGNPAPRETVKKIVEIQKPGYFQVSLEGLEGHNDYMRGGGYYARVMDFFEILHGEGVSSAVMLTLTKDNIDQILPLVEQLRGRAEYFTFNRLSQVGEGASLGLPSKKEYISFLREYVHRSEHDPIMGFKDNLINIILEEEGSGLFSGCTGYGCGAAFNFITVLPDGEAHACRKFPSPIGNILEQGISGVYGSDEAKRYRRGCTACDGCSIRHVCGGCMAISNGNKQDVFKEKDPYCFKIR